MAAPYLPVTLNGVDYLCDPVKRQTLPAIREQADQSKEPGEASLNPRGLWRRSQESWHHGTGQAFLDSIDDRDSYRFRSSKGIDVWTRGQLGLLNDTYRWRPATGTNLALVFTGHVEITITGGLLLATSSPRVFLADGQQVYRHDTAPSGAANYLTANQWSLETDATGWAALANCSISRSTTVGGASASAAALRLSSTAAGDMSATTPTGASGVPARAGDTISGSALSRAGTTARSFRVSIGFYTAAGALISTSVGATQISNVGDWLAPRATVSAIAPATTAFATLIVETLATGAAAELHYFDLMALGPNSTSGTGAVAPFQSVDIHAGEAAQAVNSLTTDGNYVWAALGTSGIHRTVGAQLATANVPGPGGASHFTHLVGYANGRLLAAGSPIAGPNTQRNALYEITSPTTAPAFSIIRAHDSTSFSWRGISPGRNCIYAWGDARGTSEVYRITIEPTGTSLGQPVSAAALPDGEIIDSLVFYSGGVVIGTNKGVRVGVVDSQGNIDFGPYISVPPVRCLEPQGRYCWFGWSSYDAMSTGLGRLDLGHFVESLVPAYASDIMAGEAGLPVTGEVVSVITYPGSLFSGEVRVFAVSGDGVYAERTVATIDSAYPYPAVVRKVPTGTLETGAIRWATTVPKMLRKLELRHHALPAGASVSVESKLDDAAYSSVGSSSAPASSGTLLSPMGSGESAELRWTLNRATDTTLGAELVRYTLKALSTPGRNEVFQVPIILKPQIEDLNGQTRHQQVDAMFAVLKALESAGTVVPLVIGSDSYDVFLDQVTLEPDALWREESGNYYAVGKCIVICQTADV